MHYFFSCTIYFSFVVSLPVNIDYFIVLLKALIKFNLKKGSVQVSSFEMVCYNIICEFKAASLQQEGKEHFQEKQLMGSFGGT